MVVNFAMVRSFWSLNVPRQTRSRSDPSGRVVLSGANWRGSRQSVRVVVRDTLQLARVPRARVSLQTSLPSRHGPCGCLALELESAVCFRLGGRGFESRSSRPCAQLIPTPSRATIASVAEFLARVYRDL